ncbi:type II toxin-antitoxin system YafQ family toxin [Treponema parvum]|uniref:Type II toxin-antitoxin system YafQ family toxin n=1 Tax=Treponema parvum TaxID=138851 RepID=A0A975EY81_9SPIR|nr:type II toxin-antitoxin system YafQ family toxin [Treponema parvum]QTQ11013.1 type II toxin-antitoxin system YafQ family toxin [Treponema parvum]
MKYKFDYTNQFKKDYRKLTNQSIIDEVDSVIDKLLNNKPLEKKYRDHALVGNYKGYRDCHIRPDLVLIYKKDNDILVLTALRVGTHSELFY